MGQILQARDFNLRLPSPKANVLTLDQLAVNRKKWNLKSSDIKVSSHQAENNEDHQPHLISQQFIPEKLII